MRIILYTVHRYTLYEDQDIPYEQFRNTAVVRVFEHATISRAISPNTLSVGFGYAARRPPPAIFSLFHHANFTYSAPEYIRSLWRVALSLPSLPTAVGMRQACYPPSPPPQRRWVTADITTMNARREFLSFNLDRHSPQVTKPHTSSNLLWIQNLHLQHKSNAVRLYVRQCQKARHNTLRVGVSTKGALPRRCSLRICRPW